MTNDSRIEEDEELRNYINAWGNAVSLIGNGYEDIPEFDYVRAFKQIKELIAMSNRNDEEA